MRVMAENQWEDSGRVMGIKAIPSWQRDSTKLGIVLVVTSGGRVAVLLQLLAHVRRANCVQGFSPSQGIQGSPWVGLTQFQNSLTHSNLKT